MQLHTCQRTTAVDARPTCISQKVAQPPKAFVSVPPCKVLRSSVLARATADQVDASANGSASGSSNPLEFDELTDIIRMVNSTDIVELELKSKRFSLSLRKKEAIAVPEAPPPQIQYIQAPQQLLPQQQQQAPASAPAMAAAPAPAAMAAPAAAPVEALIDGTEVLSPMGGTYYRSPAPGEPPFCREGDKVTKGQTIGIIEAMKLMNEIEAELSGTVVKLVAENGSPVMPGQALLIIKP